MTTFTLSYRSMQSKVRSVSLPRLNWKIFYILGIASCMLLFILYIFFINQLTQGTYLIQKYNKDINSITRENRNMESDFAETDFLSQIHDKASELGFEKTSKVSYIEILGDTGLAKK